MTEKMLESFDRLVNIMDELREKCPWDKKQTIASLRQMTIEETYELADAVTAKNWKGIKEELGDLLLHILFYSRIGKEEKQFSLQEVIDGITEKLISRHPHIYGDVQVTNADEVKSNWEKIKLKEGKKSVLEGVPRSMPAMSKAMRLQEKASQTGFDWKNKEDVWKKVEEESGELKQAIEANLQKPTPETARHVEEEFGDLMFSMINYARFLQIDAENALERTNRKFIQRFCEMEQVAMQQDKNLDKMTLEEMDEIWNAIKQHRPQ